MPKFNCVEVYRRVAVVSILLRFVPVLLLHSVPPGHDITLLGTMVRLYLLAWNKGDFFPDNWLPWYGDTQFFAFQSILAPLAASIEYIYPGFLPLVLKFLTCSAFTLYDFAAMFFLVTICSRDKESAIFYKSSTLWTAWGISCFATGIPNRFVGSGGGVFVFSLALMIYSCALFLRSIQNYKLNLRLSIIGSFILLLSFLVHPIPTVFAPFLILVHLFVNKYKLIPILTSGSIYALGLIPAGFIVRSPDALARILAKSWIHHVKNDYSKFYFSDSLKTQFVELAWDFISFPAFIIKQFGIVAILIFIALQLNQALTKEIKYFSAILIFAIFVWFGCYLPVIGLAFYPDRGAPLISLMIGVYFCKAMNEKCGGKIMFLILLLSIGQYSWSYVVQPYRVKILRADDLRVIEHIPELLEQNAFIDTNFNDAGVWIPALAARGVSEPHVHFAVEASWRKLKASIPPLHYTFSGTKCLDNPQCRVRCTSDDLELFRVGSARLCRKNF